MKVSKLQKKNTFSRKCPNILPKNVPNTIKSQEKFGRILMLTWEHRKVRRLNQTAIREDSGRCYMWKTII